MSQATIIFVGVLIFSLGQILGWFQLNSQFVWDWWKDKPLFAAIMFSVPTGICFWYGIKLCYEEWGEVWGPRFLIFSMSYLTFPLLTWWFLNESMFTANYGLRCSFVYYCWRAAILEII